MPGAVPLTMPFFDSSTSGLIIEEEEEASSSGAPGSQLAALSADEVALQRQGRTAHGLWPYDQTALQQYILLACQAPGGGLRDKPGK
jgi:hypothetical protein